MTHICLCGGTVKKLGNSDHVYACTRCGLIYLTEAEKRRRRLNGLFVPSTPTIKEAAS